MYPESVDFEKLPKQMQEVINNSSFACTQVYEFDSSFHFCTESGYTFCIIKKNGNVYLERDGKTVNFKIEL